MTTPAGQQSSQAPAKRRSGILRPWRIAFVLAAGIVAFVAAIPSILSLDLFLGRYTAGLSESLGTKVEIEDVSLGWLSGLRVRRLRVANPEGFPQERPMFEFDELEGDIAFTTLLGGRLDLQGQVLRPRLLIHQKADGTVNVTSLPGVRVEAPAGGGPPDSGGQGEPRGPAEPIDLGALRLDLDVVDAEVLVVHETDGTIEHVQRANAHLRKPFGTSDVDLGLAAHLAPRPGQERGGKIELAASLDTTFARPAELQLTAVALDLGRYETLVQGMLEPGQITALQGVLDGTLHAFVDARRRIDTSGSLDLAAPRFAGALLHGMRLEADRWRLEPRLQIAVLDDGGATVRTEGFGLDLGFATLTGLAAAESGDRPGFRFDVDLERLAALGGPIPADLQGSGGRIAGTLVIDQSGLGADLPAELGPLLDLLDLDVRASLTRYPLAGHPLENLALGLRVADRALHVRTEPGGLLATGGLHVEASVPDLAQASPALSVKLDWQGGQVGGEAVGLLRYAVPLLAGIDAGAGARLAGQADTALELTGPLLPEDGQSWLQWADRWSGDGRLALHGLQFAPAPELGGLLALAGAAGGDGGAPGMLELGELAGSFALREGFVETELSELSEEAARIGLRGRTGLDGTLDHALDIAGLLARHGDGRRVLGLLGGEVPAAKLGGTLDAPRLALPDLQTMLQGAIREAGHEALRQGLEKGIDELLGGKQGDGAAKPEDAVREAAGSILRGILPGPKKTPEGGKPEGGDGEPPPEISEDAARKAAEELLRGLLPPKRRG